MKNSWLRRLAQILTVFTVGMLLVSAVMLYLAPDAYNFNRVGNLGSSLVALGAPILGLIIATRQPRNRIGWLWIFYGLLVGIRSLGHAIYYLADAQPVGYSALEYFLLWSTEPANVSIFACLILLLLWFPDGQLPSRRWRFLYIWFFLALLCCFQVYSSQVRTGMGVQMREVL